MTFELRSLRSESSMVTLAEPRMSVAAAIYNLAVYQLGKPSALLIAPAVSLRRMAPMSPPFQAIHGANLFR